MRALGSSVAVMVLLLPMTAAWGQDAQDRITPATPDTSIFSTHDAAPAEEMPKQPEMPEGVSTFQKTEPLLQEGGKPSFPTALPFKPAAGAEAGAAPAKMPFGRGEAAKMPDVPSGPHKTEAVPVVNVDSVEASEPAPPTPVAPEADPTQENPADPTELTAPIFGEEENKLAPRKIILRALNKVTAQSATLTLKPGEKILFGQLEITGTNCQTSAASSQTDYAALLEIAEKQPADASLKPIFKGWMYASSPSITGLEHPIYDITMVECRMMPVAQKEDEKPEKPVKKTEKKVEKKSKR